MQKQGEGNPLDPKMIINMVSSLKSLEPSVNILSFKVEGSVTSVNSKYYSFFILKCETQFEQSVNDLIT